MYKSAFCTYDGTTLTVKTKKSDHFAIPNKLRTILLNQPPKRVVLVRLSKNSPPAALHDLVEVEAISAQLEVESFMAALLNTEPTIVGGPTVSPYFLIYFQPIT